MTSFTLILGVLPLVFARGAGAQSRQSLGTAVCGGMLGVTALGVIFTPVLYVAIQRFVGWLRRLTGRTAGPTPASAD
jgi:HAE1 family hydrophobic/amphiphilic exporter-1